MAEFAGPRPEDGEYEWLSAAEAASTWTLHRQSARAASACVRREREFHQCRCACRWYKSESAPFCTGSAVSHEKGQIDPASFGIFGYKTT